jgi:hypothetical protein
MANADELERRPIGERTKAALAVKKAHGTRLGRPRQTRTPAVASVDCGSNPIQYPEGAGAACAWRSSVERLGAACSLQRTLNLKK